MTDASGVSLDIPMEALEATEQVLRYEYGFPAGHVDSYIEELTRSGKDYRKQCFKDAKNGNHARAFIYHKMAEDNLSSVKWWMARKDYYNE